MNQKTLQAAIIEAERFLDLAKELHMQSAHIEIDWQGPPSSAVRRASMDLTIALIDLNWPEWTTNPNS